MPSFADRLKALRTERNYSQQLLANYLKISKSSVNMYERGEREPGIEVLESIADLFNVDMDYLVGRSDIPNRYKLTIKQAEEKQHETDSSPAEPIIKEINELLTQLDYEDRIEIRATAKYMLKAAKYRENKESKNA